MTGPHRLRLIGGRRTGAHTRRVVVERHRADWRILTLVAWCLAIGWTLGSYFPPVGTAGIPVGCFAVAVAVTALTVVAERRRR